MGNSESKGYLLGVPMIRTTAFVQAYLLGCPYNKDCRILGLYWGPLIFGNFRVCNVLVQRERSPGVS